MAKRRRWEEELERELEREGKPKLAELDPAKRAGVVEEIQRSSGNRAFQQVVGTQSLQREAAPTGAPAKVTQPFMKIKGIRGPSTLKGFEGAFELEQDYELEVKAPTDLRSGKAVGKRTYSDLKVVVRKSAGVTSLRQAIATNQILEEIVLTAPVQDAVETTTLKKSVVVGVKDLGNGNVEIRFSFEKISWDAGQLSTADERTMEGVH